MSSVRPIVITDDERFFFDSIWELHMKEDSENSKIMLDSFLEMLSTKYLFDIHKFVINDRQGNMVHQRMPRVQRSKDLVN